jgi:hypothetical protein
MSLWDDMLDEFRALGGIAENVSLGEGRYGRGLFPIDPAKPVKLHIPESLLLEDKYITFDTGTFRVSPEALMGPREKQFLEAYERDFSWGVGRTHIEELLQMMNEAPAELQLLLRQNFECYRWLAEPTPEIVQDRYFTSRTITYKGTSVVMPIVELANHGHETQYVRSEGVGLSGQFSGEILVRYQLADPLNIFNKWGFVSDSESFALSLGLRQEAASGTIVIGTELLSLGARKPFFPEAVVEGKNIRIPFVLLGHKSQQRLPRGIFSRVLRNAGRMRAEADETFDVVQHLNRSGWYRLTALCEDAAPPLARLLRSVARAQLELMSFYGGTCEV